MMVTVVAISASLYYGRTNRLDEVCKPLIAPFKAVEIAEMMNSRKVHAQEIVLPTPTPEPKTEKEQIKAYIHEKFGERADDAILMLETCENSKLNPKISNKNRNGTIDRGVFQINSIHGGEEMFDWKTNIDMAYKIYKGHDNTFYAWTCGYVANDRTYVDALNGR